MHILLKRFVKMRHYGFFEQHPEAWQIVEYAAEFRDFA